MDLGLDDRDDSRQLITGGRAECAAMDLGLDDRDDLRA